MKEKIIVAITISLLVFPTVFANVTYQNTCAIGNCPLAVSDCSSGLIDLFVKPDCSGNPSYEYTFSNGVLPWPPTIAQTLYAYALCDDGKTRSACSPITVSPLASNITSSTTTTTTIQTQPSASSTPTQTISDNSNIVFYVLIIVVIVVVAFIIYRLLFSKKKPKIDYETLYKKWGR